MSECTIIVMNMVDWQERIAGTFHVEYHHPNPCLESPSLPMLAVLAQYSAFGGTTSNNYEYWKLL